MRKAIVTLVGLNLFIIFSACEKDEKKKGAAVLASLELTNATSLSLVDAPCPDLGNGEVAECWTPSQYAFKVLNVTVSPDAAGAQTAPAGLIWANPDCAITSMNSTLEDKEYEYDSASDCTDDQVSEFFNLARASAAVNAELNSQPHKILPGTYNYVQMDFCKGGAITKNGKFQADGMAEPYEITLGGCGLSSIKADPPIVVAEGESIKISLSYDLTNIVYPGDENSNADYCYKNDEDSIYRCTSGPNNLLPSFAPQ